MKNFSWPKLGCGVGLRAPHYSTITQDWPKVDWFEAITENYMDSGGRPVFLLEEIRSHYPIALHGVALSIGSTDPLNQNYLTRLKNLVERIDPAIVSDHLCWSGAGGEQLHDLLPLPFTEESIDHVVSRVSQVQDFLKRPILMENVSTYVTFQHSVIPEWEFLNEVASRSGCGILLDINNIYVNSKNHQFDPSLYLSHITGEKIGQFHMAGHIDKGTYLFDTHSKPVIEPVWNLYRQALQQWGQISTLIEWDEDIPNWAGLMEERDRAKKIYDEYQNHDKKLPASVSPVSFHARPVKKEKTLKEIQDWMKSRIQSSSEVLPGDSPLNPQGNTLGEERVSVYAEAYLARIHDGLLDVYEATHEGLGKERFRALSQMYAEHYPSHDYNLSLVGRHLPELIHQFPIKDMPYLEDLARFEWRMAESFHAFNEPSFDPAPLAQVPLDAWESSRLFFQPSVSLFSSPWPVLDLWKDRKSFPRDARIEPKTNFILIGRKGTKVRCEILDENQYRLLESLFAGKTLGEACDKLAGTSGEGNLPIEGWFASWVQDDLIAKCEVNEKNKT